MGTVISAVGYISCLLLCYFVANHVSYKKRLARNHRRINEYKKLGDPYIKGLINSFKEKYSFSLEELNNLSGKKLESYVDATDDLLKDIKIHSGVIVWI